jgi:hypothetical protein
LGWLAANPTYDTLPRGNGIWLANNALWFFAKRAIALKLVYPHIMLIIMMTRVGVCW